MTEVDIMPVNLHLDFAEFAVPILILGIVAEGVIGGTIRNALADGVLNPVPIIKSLAAGVSRQIIHGSVDPKVLIEILACESQDSGTDVDGPDSKVIRPADSDVIQGNDLQRMRVNGIDGHLRVHQHVVRVLVVSLQIIAGGGLKPEF